MPLMFLLVLHCLLCFPSCTGGDWTASKCMRALCSLLTGDWITGTLEQDEERRGEPLAKRPSPKHKAQLSWQRDRIPNTRHSSYGKKTESQAQSTALMAKRLSPKHKAQLSWQRDRVPNTKQSSHGKETESQTQSIALMEKRPSPKHKA